MPALGTEPSSCQLMQVSYARNAMLFLLKLQAFRKYLLTPKWVTVREISGQNDLKNSSRAASIVIFKYLLNVSS